MVTKLIQITDLHLAADPDAIVSGWHANQAWLSVLSHVQKHHANADAWILSGDLVHDESERGYRRLNQQLKQLNKPVIALAGNHDDPQAMQRLLTCADVHGTTKIGPLTLHALNSHIDAKTAGALTKAELNRLEQALITDRSPTLIFLHHPPVQLGAHWLDQIMLTNSQALKTLVAQHSHVLAISCGHAHQEFSGLLAGIPCWVTPSTMRQFLPLAHDFTLDNQAAPGYRVIRYDRNNQQLSSEVIRIGTLQAGCG